MSVPPAPDFTRADLPGGGVRFCLPDHGDATLAAVCVPLLVVFFLLLHVSMAFFCPLFLTFAFLIWVACPMQHYFFRGRVEVTVTANAVVVRRKSGPFWRTHRMTPVEVRAVVSVIPAVFSSDDLLLRVDLEAEKRPTIRLSTDTMGFPEPPELLRRFRDELVTAIAAARPPGTAPVLTVTAEDTVAQDRSRYTVREGTIRRDTPLPGRLLPWVSARTVPIGDVRRLVLVRDKLVAVLPGGEPWVLTAKQPAAANWKLARLLDEMCGRAGEALPELEEEAEPSGRARPQRPVFGRVRAEVYADRTVLATPTGFGGPKPVTATVTADGALHVEWPAFWGKRRREWPPGGVRTVVAAVARTTDSEGCESERWELRVVPTVGEPWPVPRLGAGDTADAGKDCEWLATTLAALVSPQLPVS